MINEFYTKVQAVRAASNALDGLPSGYFVRVGKRKEKGLVVWWVMVPTVGEAEKNE